MRPPAGNLECNKTAALELSGITFVPGKVSGAAIPQCGHRWNLAILIGVLEHANAIFGTRSSFVSRDESLKDSIILSCPPT
jgi:hypothetical protein